jgi:hypothetical protein
MQGQTLQIHTQKASATWVHNCNPQTHTMGTLSAKIKSLKCNVACAKHIETPKYIHCMRTYTIWQSITVEGSESTTLAQSN